ncbi:hypothetical protein Sango_1099200 [Sesamum angolense]|uniref:Uncharacterized protein n=1 Tax=Sesamum angolense TaxID=2727404 RepID=A0AAE1WV13_9LAMI|nr:hypothetical protein Sango_1099200 [Sesamum angolense]
MGKKLDALLGRRFKTSKFQTHGCAGRFPAGFSRTSARRGARLHGRSVFLSSLSNHDRALLRVEQVIKEQNMLDVVCPEELKEAVSTLIFAATRCGEFPELQQIRAIFTSVSAKNLQLGLLNCIIQKLSTKPPSLENKMKVLKIASDNNIDVPIEETVSVIRMPADEVDGSEDFSDTLKIRRKYKDVADAAEEAFKSAAYAAAAARAAVELSRSESTDPDDPNTPNIRLRKVSAMIKPIKAELQTHEEDIGEHEHKKTEVKFEKIHPVQSYDLESKDAGIHEEKGVEQLKGNKNGTEFKRSLSASSSDSSDDDVKGVSLSSDEAGQSKKGGVVFDESDGEDELEMRVPGTYDLDAGQKNDVFEGRSRAQVGVKLKMGPGNSNAQFAAEKKTQIIEPLNIKEADLCEDQMAHR